MFRYIRYNNTLGLKYYADMKDAPLSELLRLAIIKTENNFIVFSYYSWKHCTDTGRSKGEYVIMYWCGPIDYGTHVPGPVAQSSSEIEYNVSCTAVIALAHLRMLIREFLNKYPDIVQEESPPIILGVNYDLFMA